MSGRGAWSHEHRENLAELDPDLRSRLLRLDEPVDRSDWDAVVQRSRAARPSRQRSFALAASGAAVLSLACALAWMQLHPGAGRASLEAAPLRLALHLSDGSNLVLYSGAKQSRFLDNSDGRLAAARPASASGTSHAAAVARSLSGGPFHVRAELVHVGSTLKDVGDGPLAGDQALVSFPVFTTAGLETTAGSAVLTCMYDFDRNAYCDGAIDLENGTQLTASGTLDADADHFTLMVAGDGDRGVLAASPRDPAPSDLD